MDPIPGDPRALGDASLVAGARPAPKAVWARRATIAIIIVLALVAVYAVGRRLVLGPDRFTIEQTSEVVSRVDGMRYRVHGGHDAPSAPPTRSRPSTAA